MKVLCVGEALIDMICTDKGLPLQEGSHFLKKPGGAPTNVAAAIAAMGGQVDLMANVGKDAFGDHLIATMQNFGVGTKFLFADKKHFTSMAFVSLMLDGERDFVFNRGADGMLSLSDFPNFKINDYDVIHFGSATAFLDGPLKTTYFELLDLALQHHLFISFDPNFRSLLFKEGVTTFIESSWKFLCACHFFKVSEEEALLLTSANTLLEAIDVLIDKTKAAFAITLGHKGTFLRYNNHQLTIPSIVVDVKDTTGAGDAFVGAILYQIANATSNQVSEWDVDTWKQVVFNANKAGARTCEHLGAMEAFKQLSTDIFD